MSADWGGGHTEQKCKAWEAGVLSCASDSGGSQGQHSQWGAGLLFCYCKGSMFTGKSGEVRFHSLCGVSSWSPLQLWVDQVCRVEEGLLIHAETPRMDTCTLVGPCWQWKVQGCSNIHLLRGCQDVDRGASHFAGGLVKIVGIWVAWKLGLE